MRCATWWWSFDRGGTAPTVLTLRRGWFLIKQVPFSATGGYVPIPCTSASHAALQHGPIDAFLENTVPLVSGDRPVGDDGLMYSDCPRCRSTICRRVRCMFCGYARKNNSEG